MDVCEKKNGRAAEERDPPRRMIAALHEEYSLPQQPKEQQRLSPRKKTPKDTVEDVDAMTDERRLRLAPVAGVALEALALAGLVVALPAAAALVRVVVGLDIFRDEREQVGLGLDVRRVVVDRLIDADLMLT
eukprot:CAMPEP_0185711964 /NCGR_PEP_ID=MMETSP1164-20130828/33842_1 /TAXON_ID=1104430 /ORGANISM="Chrysoreinhardia sp, Strain CCMP2950" /LENGTH=131 /DNA_ID=CAMNT_0028379509 /DNA_START=38 /DNA_END=431 /DNA_ORIENTATION=+